MTAREKDKNAIYEHDGIKRFSLENASKSTQKGIYKHIDAEVLSQELRVLWIAGIAWIFINGNSDLIAQDDFVKFYEKSQEEYGKTFCEKATTYEWSPQKHEMDWKLKAIDKDAYNRITSSSNEI